MDERIINELSSSLRESHVVGYGVVCALTQLALS